MSLVVSDYPVKNVGQNIFAGDSPVEVTFVREDLQIVSTEQGSDNTIIINVTTDLTSVLNAGEYVYLKSEVYDLSGEVLELTATGIRINKQWIGEDTAGGFINYKQNYYVELDIINPLNDLDKILPFTLRDDGDEKGNIKIDLSIINDLNSIDFPAFLEFYEMIESRVKFDIKYREIWRESPSTAYIRINDPIIIFPAKIDGGIEKFSNGFDLPEYYKGYPNGAVFLHSDSDPLASDDIVAYYDELDINKDTIKANQEVGTLAAREVYGRLFAPLVDLPLLENTEYLTLKTEAAAIPEFSPIDFTNDFNIG